MKLFKKLFSKKEKKYIKLTKEYEDMGAWDKTDVLCDVVDCPFITLTESKMLNVWYHDEMDYLFRYSREGFYRIKDGSKKELIKQLLIR